MRILYVEDEKILADAVIHILDKSGITVDWTPNGEEGLNLAMKEVYDVIVLDIMLPTISGLDILQDIRKKGINTPVIMLSALSQVEDKIKGLNFGADDYLAKPFKTQELIARIRALTRRPPLSNPKSLNYEDLEYDVENRTLNNMPLSEKEADLLEALIKDPDHVKSKKYLLSHVWGQDGDDNYVEVYITYLRRKLQKLKSNVTIKTVRGLGYKLCSKN